MTGRKWPGYGQDGEDGRATGRTFGDGLARGMYDDARRVGDYRQMCGRNRDTRERYRWAQARIQGRRGRN